MRSFSTQQIKQLFYSFTETYINAINQSIVVDYHPVVEKKFVMESFRGRKRGEEEVENEPE